MIATQSDKRPARVRIFVLGGFRVVVDGRERRLRTRKEAVLLLRLALAGSAGVGRDDCMAMLWPDSSEARARHSLSEALRGVELGTGLSIERTPERVAVADDAIETDLHALDVALERGDIAEASRLYLGSFLAGWYPPTAEASHWVDGKAAAVESKLLKTTRARLDVMRAATDSRGVTAAVALLERLGAATDADREAAAEAEQITGWETLRAGEGVPSRLPIDREGPFVGRVEEMKVLTGELEKALAGELRVVLVSGEAGIGKTRICQRLARLAALRGCRLFMASCYEAEISVPYGTITELFTDNVSKDAFANLKPRFQRAIEEILPDVPEGSEADHSALAPSEVHFVHRAFVELLSACSDSRTSFVWVDDLQWSDATSCEFLHQAIRSPAPRSGALFVLTCRAPVNTGHGPDPSPDLSPLSGRQMG